MHNNGKDNLGKFDSKSDEAIFLGYSLTSKAYRVFNKRTLVVEESIHVAFDETNIFAQKQIDSDNIDLEPNVEDSSIYKEENQPCNLNKEIEQPIIPPQEEGGNNDDLPREWKFVHNHPKDLILGDPTKGIETRSLLRNICSNLAFLSQIEPKNFQEVEFDEH